MIEFNGKTLEELLRESAREVNQAFAERERREETQKEQEIEEEALGVDDKDPGFSDLLERFTDSTLDEREEGILAKKIAKMEPLSMERLLAEISIQSASCIKNILRGINPEVNNARNAQLIEMRFKVLGEFRSSTSPDVEEKVKSQVEGFKERGVQHLSDLLHREDLSPEEKLMKWARLMQSEGF